MREATRDPSVAALRDGRHGRLAPLAHPRPPRPHRLRRPLRALRRADPRRDRRLQRTRRRATGRRSSTATTSSSSKGTADGASRTILLERARLTAALRGRRAHGRRSALVVSHDAASRSCPTSVAAADGAARRCDASFRWRCSAWCRQRSLVAMFVVARRAPARLHWTSRTSSIRRRRRFLTGENPYPGAIWPPLAALVAMPFTVLPSTRPGVAFGLAGLGCIALALWLVGVRDWRVYGVVGLWPPVLGDIRIAHLTPLLCLLAAVVWRYRDRPVAAGFAARHCAGGLKFFLWPLGVWLLATGRARAAAAAAVVAVAAARSCSSSLRAARRLPRHAPRRQPSAFDQDSYSIFGSSRSSESSDAAAASRRSRLGAAPAGPHVASPELRARDRRGARSLPDRLARLLRAGRVPTRDRAAAARPVWFLPLVTWGSRARDRDRRVGRRACASRARDRSARRG